jgi:hypothetical protein
VLAPLRLVERRQCDAAWQQLAQILGDLPASGAVSEYIELSVHMYCEHIKIVRALLGGDDAQQRHHFRAR